MSPTSTLVIGGGPSAFGALIGLLEGGERPDLLSPQGPWPGPCVDPGSSAKSRLARKTRFGKSDMYLYPEVMGLRPETEGPLALSSVPGGLSSVWGSNIQVFSGSDLAPWGDQATSMHSSYASMLRLISHQGADDGLSQRFPWPVEFPGRQPVSRRVARALAQVPRGASHGALVGLARNATAPWQQGCIACGRCLDGCPEDAIFDAARPLSHLAVEHNLTILDGLAISLEETASGVHVDYVDRQSQGRVAASYDRVLLAAGSIASAALLMQSGLLADAVELCDTQVFYVPLLPLSAPDAGGTAFTLAQIFVTGDRSDPDRDFHLSVYESDPSFRQRAEGLVGPAARLIPQRMYRQLMAAIGFIPEHLSGRVRLSRARGDEGVSVTTATNPDTRHAVTRALRTAAPVLRAAGIRPLSPLAQISSVGASYHSGRLMSSDRALVRVGDGLLEGSHAVHVVDGGALPSLPPGPVTLTMMANAHRIASGMSSGA